jgi:hypothetical protein
MNYIPWTESIPLGISGRELWYTTPQDTPIIICGFNLVFSQLVPFSRSFDLQLSESSAPDTWMPFFFAPYRAVVGYQDQGVNAINPLPEPFRMRPFSRVQIALRIGTGFFVVGEKNTLTLVGVREVMA